MPVRANSTILNPGACHGKEAHHPDCTETFDTLPFVPLVPQAARHYAAVRGFHCYPLRPDTRRAYLTFARTGRKWGATDDPDLLGRMFERYDTAELCIVTGELSGIFVLDVDVPKPGRAGRDGPATLARLIAQHGPMPTTLTARTPSGGAHYFFLHPGFYVKNSVGKIGADDPKVSSGLDIRGDGGMVVAAPSKGRVWLDPHHAISSAPKWLLDEIGGGPDLLSAPRAKGSRERRITTGQRRRPVPVADAVSEMMLQDAGRGLSEAIEDNRDDMWLKVHLALTAIPPDRIEYDDWFAIAAAIYNEVGDVRRYGKTGFDLFNEWSARDKTLCASARGGVGSPRYTKTGCEEKWLEIKTYTAAHRPARFGKIHAIALRFDPDQEWRKQYNELMGNGT